MKTTLITTLSLLTAALCLPGCSLAPKPSADATRHYVLALGPGQTPAAAREITKGKPAAALRPVELPAYLRGRKNIAIRRGANEIVYHDFARWAETLEDGVSRIVSERLTDTASVSGIARLPSRSPRDCDISIRIAECEGVIPSGGAAPGIRFSAEYEITIPGAPAVRRAFAAPPAQWDGKDFSALASLLAQSIGALADDIAKNLPAKK